MANVADCEKRAGKERKIVVAVDNSKESMYALQWCFLNLVPSLHSTDLIVLIYARPPLPQYSMFDGAAFFVSEEVVASMDQYSKDLATTVLDKVENICKSYINNKNIKILAKAKRGDARDVICDTAESIGADILVMGSHGYGFIKRALIGSVSDYCARNAKCPVVIVKCPAEARA